MRLASRPRSPSLVRASALASLALLLPREARAFCRTTTCTCTSASTCATDCPRDGSGCLSTGTPLAWTGGCTGFSLSVAGTSTLTEDEWTTAIVQAFDSWMAVDCGGGHAPSIDLVQLRNVSCSLSQYNPSGPNVNVVYFEDNGWTGTDIDGTLAATSVTFDPSGAILDADVAINSSRNDFTVTDADVQNDLVSVVTHEAGHFLGLAHSPDPSAVMYFSYEPGTLKRTLTADDIAAVCAAYPPGRPGAATCDPTPRGGLESSCTAGGGCGVAGAAGAAGAAGTELPVVLAVIACVGMGGIARRRRRR